MISSKPEPLKGSALVFLTFSVSLGIFMNILDITIANVAIPTIAGDLAVSPDQGTWVITSFSVSMAIMLPLTGWLARRIGEVKLYVASTFLFTVVSLLCGLTESFTSLIFLRVIQGAVAGPMIPLSQSLLLSNYPSDKQGLATSLWAMVAVAGPVMGPILGGYITDNFRWPWIFYINVPVGLVSSFFTWSLLKDRETETIKTPIDFIGLILLTTGIACLQVLLDRGKDLDWFNSSTIVTLAVISLISLSILIIWELTEKHPIVDLTLFEIRNFTVGTIAISLGYMTYFGSVVILPLWLQTQQNYTATWAGLVTAPLGVLPIILSPIVGKFINKVDLRLLVSFGFMVFAYCSFWISNFYTEVTAGEIAWIRFIQGIGAPCFFIPTITILLSGLPNNRLASASGLSNFFRILAGSFGTSISVTLWSDRQSLHQSRLVESIQSYNPIWLNELQKLNSLSFPTLSSYDVIYQEVIRQAYMLATDDVFYLSGYIFLGLLVLIWFSKPPFNTPSKVTAD